MITKVFIARHGFRLNWVTNTWTCPTGLPRDPPLAAFGETQAEELAQYFLALPEAERPTVILSSGFYRCLQTAAPTSRALGIPIFVEHGLGEWYSHVVPGTGLHPRPGSSEFLHGFFPEVSTTGWQTVFYPPRKGEDVEEVHARAAATLEATLSQLERLAPNRHSRIVLFTHAATAIALARGLLNDPHRPMRIGCCTLSIFQRAADAPSDVLLGHDVWHADCIGDGSHLKEGALRDWGFEDVQIENGKVINDPGDPGTENEIDDPVGLQIAGIARM